MRKLVLVSVVFGTLLAASSAQAAIPDVFGGAVTCTVVGQQRQCGTEPSSDADPGAAAPLRAGTGLRSTSRSLSLRIQVRARTATTP